MEVRSRGEPAPAPPQRGCTGAPLVSIRPSARQGRPASPSLPPGPWQSPFPGTGSLGIPCRLTPPTQRARGASVQEISVTKRMLEPPGQRRPELGPPAPLQDVLNQRERREGSPAQTKQGCWQAEGTPGPLPCASFLCWGKGKSSLFPLSLRGAENLREDKASLCTQL